MRPTVRPIRGLGLLLLLSASPSLSATTFTVTSTSDSGPGSLRQAILDANATPGADSIHFAIPGSGVHTITPLSALPTITDPVVLDGMTQPGYAGNPLIEISGASAGAGADGFTVVAGSSTIRGFVINRFQAAFLGGGGNGISLQNGGGNDVWGNFIGTNSAGTTALPNQASGILISGSSNNRIRFLGVVAGLGNLISGNGTGIRIIGNSNANVMDNNFIGVGLNGLALPNSGAGILVAGGTGNAITGGGMLQVANIVAGNAGDGIQIAAPATGTNVSFVSIGGGSAVPGNGGNGVQINGSSGNSIGPGNTISGNGANGVLIISGATGNFVLGNRIGTDSQGSSARPNAFNGVIVSAAQGNVIGGAASGDGNLISANGTNGVRLRSGASGNLVVGNRIGTDSNGTAALPNTLEGVQINDGATSNVVGGSGANEANVICGNGSNGILIVDAATVNNVVRGNRIGVTDAGLSLGNALGGVSIESAASANTIGGVSAGEGNTIAFNLGAGVFVESGTGNSFRGNSIYANGSLAIDLAPVGVTANDHCDGDAGANQLQNFPVLSAASSLAGTTTIEGTLDSTASSSFTVDFYANTGCNPSGYGPGRTWIGSAPVMTDASCAASFQVPISTTFPVRFVTATATDVSGNTSEFSACVPVPGSFYPVTPCRVIDTRTGTGPLAGPSLAANADRVFPIAGQCGIPPTAKAAALNFTITQPTAAGHLRVYAAGAPPPNTSAMNYGSAQTRANNAVVTLGTAGDFVVRCVQASGTVQLIVDVVGYIE